MNGWAKKYLPTASRRNREVKRERERKWGQEKWAELMKKLSIGLGFCAAQLLARTELELFTQLNN